ncbi:hypothetical protein [Rhodopila sp.]|uniref:hypothetical protein n=1 Tax=Rhodopila sp. TaxID=2480087 RepID=UPI003D0BC970
MTMLHQDDNVHFVQQSEGPVFVGPGSDTLACDCGSPLIAGYDPARFRSISLRCGRCGQVTTTPGLPNDAAPPFAVIIAEPVAEPRPVATTLPAHVFVIGRSEMDRIAALYQPATPPDNVYRIGPALLEQAIATHDRLSDQPLAVGDANPVDPYHGLGEHALAWAIRHLRARMRQPGWRCLDDIATPVAAVHLTGFLHFVATWSHHPLFAAMVAGVAMRGFSLHGLAPFASAHCLTMQGNRISFPHPTGDLARIDSFNLATGPTETVAVQVEPFDRFEVPFGQSWDPAGLRAAVADRIAGSQARINLRNPGLLVLSPGCALAGYDEALIEAVKHAMQAHGRKNRGLMAVAPIVLRLQATPDPQAVRFGYGLFPIANKRYEGDSLLLPSG